MTFILSWPAPGKGGCVEFINVANSIEGKHREEDLLSSLTKDGKKKYTGLRRKIYCVKLGKERVVMVCG